jgi:hypothetical protein
MENRQEIKHYYEVNVYQYKILMKMRGKLIGITMIITDVKQGCGLSQYYLIFIYNRLRIYGMGHFLIWGLQLEIKFHSVLFADVKIIFTQDGEDISYMTRELIYE